MSDGYSDSLSGPTSDADAEPPDADADANTDTDTVPEAASEDDPMAVHPEEVDREFDYRGWTLVVAVFVAFIAIPGIIFLYPHVGPMFGLTFWDTYLALPMIPAIVLGVLAVWATTRP